MKSFPHFLSSLSESVHKNDDPVLGSQQWEPRTEMNELKSPASADTKLDDPKLNVPT